MNINQLCSNCRLEPVRSHGQRLCRTCHAAYMREWRKTHRLKGIQREKANCRRYSGMLTKRGSIQKRPCEICQDKNSQRHHENYSNHSEVHWLCRKHHLMYHRGEITLPRQQRCRPAMTVFLLPEQTLMSRICRDLEIESIPCHQQPLIMPRMSKKSKAYNAKKAADGGKMPAAPKAKKMMKKKKK